MTTFAEFAPYLTHILATKQRHRLFYALSDSVPLKYVTIDEPYPTTTAPRRAPGGPTDQGGDQRGGKRFRPAGFNSAIRPRFLVVCLEGVNHLFLMDPVIAAVQSQPCPAAKAQTLEQVWVGLRDFGANDSMRRELYITYLYQPLLGGLRSWAEAAAQAWRSSRQSPLITEEDECIEQLKRRQPKPGKGSCGAGSDFVVPPPPPKQFEGVFVNYKKCKRRM
eukprot:TRINITY_DN6297_c0_g1_i4.p1 TRINITY_DN6297_c0_g1~~TRINITY_DN6297_c0_g1_i4.p1  ORF type:complete len:221 (-),score=37.47 TRINITY_DN6297_c0_g1_i4:645-1307(-)